MICAIHQPMFYPYIGFFDKMIKSDIFVLLDDAQFEKNGWQNRNRIRLNTGEVKWITVPVKHKFGQTINEVEIVNDKWNIKIYKTLEQSYKKSSCYNEVLNKLFIRKTFFSKKLKHICIHSIVDVRNYYGISDYNDIKYSSSLNLTSTKTQKLIDICHAYECDQYLAGDGSKNYLDVKLMEKNGIEVIWQNFKHPMYPQKQIKNNFYIFVYNLSILDYMFNLGKKAFKNAFRVNFSS